ncbi:MAG: ATP-binding cassette domain-containing protein [Sphingobacteriia bacterium]|nr:ATP-binding cassette domain-containing protein [Sphingobacteriia bacterium]
MQTRIVEVNDLSHRYSRCWAVQNIGFSIKSTGILGLLGSNGAGKSTTMNILCGVLSQTKGTVLVDGLDIRKHPETVKRKIGFLPQQAPLHMDLTVREYLVYCAHIKDVERSNLIKLVDVAMVRCGVKHFSDRLIRNLSGGYRQRVGIAQAILHQPKLVVLDEPTNGLDPNQILEVRELIKDIGQEHAVIFSSHILSEIEATCQDVLMIEQGRVVFSDTLQAFNNYITPRSLTVHFLDAPPAIVLQSVLGVQSAIVVAEGVYRIQFADRPRIAEEIVAISMERNWRLVEISYDRVSADEIFHELSKTKHN